MKTIYKKGRTGLKGMALAVLALLLLPPLFVNGQEFTKEMTNIKGASSIIRSWTNKIYMVSGLNNNVPFFAEINDVGITTDILHLTKIASYVYDFEILNDTLYFCGTKWGVEGATAVMGYFCLTSFPSVQVYACTVPLMASCQKLEVGHFNGTRHVVMTGNAILGTSHIVDARDMGSDQWNFNIPYYTDEIDVYDDVALTDNYVVVSARDTALKEGYLCLFDQPAANSSLMPQSNAQYLKFMHDVYGNILLEHCTADTIAFLTQYAANGYATSILDVTNPVFSTERLFPVSTDIMTMDDIRYNIYARRADVLMQNLTAGASEVLHVAFSPSTTVMGHQYYGENLLSLDELTNGYFVAVGIASSGSLGIYRCSFNSFPICSTQSTRTVSLGGRYIVDSQLLPLPSVNIKVTASCYSRSGSPMPITTICQ